MVRILMTAAVAATMVVGAAANATQCRDAKGHFTKCTKVTTTTKSTTVSNRCRDAKGHFAKCGAPGAHPA